MRVFLDTNVLVSAVATRGLCADLLRVVLSEHQLVVGEAVIIELGRVLRDKLRLPAAIADEMVEFLRQQASIVADTVALEFTLRDPDDLEMLGEAIASNADVLVTGDRDLLDITFEAPLEIVSPRAFWERLRIDPRTEE